MHACKLLIIDDEGRNARLLERFLTRAGFDNITTTDSREAATLFTDFEPDLVLADLLTPDADGCAVIDDLRLLMATDDCLPIMVLTADARLEARKRALAAGATDVVIKPFDQNEFLLRMQNLLKARLSHLIIQREKATLEDSVRQRTHELERTLVELQRAQRLVVQQECLATFGATAGRIAHDINNALSIITGFGELLLRDAEHGLTKERATPSLNTILAAAMDAANIVNRPCQFYSKNAHRYAGTSS